MEIIIIANARSIRNSIMYSLCGPKAKPIGIKPNMKSTPPETDVLPSVKAV